MDPFILAKCLTIKKRGRDFICLTLMTFILEIGLITLWMGMVLMSLFLDKSIKGSLRKGSKKGTGDVFILMVSHMKVFGIRIIRLG